MLRISHLSVDIAQKKIIHNLSLSIKPGSTHAIMGPNGSGKSSLAYTLAGHPNYSIISGSIEFKNQNITELSPDKRARLGVFLAFQQPVVIPGVRVITFLHEAHAAVKGERMLLSDFQKLLTTYMEKLSMDPAVMHRNVNEGFSGGEKKRLELLQLLVLQPSLVILDEIDSGLDIDALRNVSQVLKIAREYNPIMSVIIITHYQRMLKYVTPDAVHVLCNGVIVESGDTTLVDTLEKNGYDAYTKI